MKQFKEGQIVKATESTYYLEAGEIAEVKFTEGNPELCLVFYEGTDRESKWPCSECGSVHDRDTNAARNILARGHARLAVGISGVSPERMSS